MAMRVPKIQVQEQKLPQLIDAIQKGEIRIPGFQRDFVWEPKRITTLLDSMVKEYPIGTIFLWNAPSEYNNLLRDIDIVSQPPKDMTKRYSFLLDGQQRLTSLYVTINGLTIEGEDYSRIVVDLRHGDPQTPIFKKRSGTNDDPRYVSVKDLLAFSTTRLTRSMDDELLAKFEEYRTVLSTYPFSVVTVSEMSLDDAIEIFERINRQGRRLDRFDLVAASLFSEEFDLRKLTETDIQRPLATTFGEISVSTIPQTLALAVKGNSEFSTQIALKASDVKDKWDNVVKAILDGVSLLRSHFKVSSEPLLPYDALLPILSYYFFENGSLAANHRPKLEQWFWTASFTERYSSASQTRMSEDAAWIRSLIKDGTPFGEALTTDLRAIEESRLTHTTSAIRNGVLCLLRLQEPRSIENGVALVLETPEFTRISDAEKYHIFPRSLTSAHPLGNSVVNFWYMDDDTYNRKKLGDLAPNEMFESLKADLGERQFQQIMYSHLIPVDPESGIWTNDFKTFLDQRARLILATVYELAGIADNRTDLNEDPVVNSIEVALRDLLDSGLTSQFGKSYWQNIPQQIQTDIGKTIGTDASRKGIDPTSILAVPRECLNYANPSDYRVLIKLIGTHISPSKPDLWDRNLADWQDFRNSSKHNRKSDTLLRSRGLAACIWLSRVLKLDLSQYGVF